MNMTAQYSNLTHICDLNPELFENSLFNDACQSACDKNTAPFCANIKCILKYRGEVKNDVKGSLFCLENCREESGRRDKECKFQNTAHRTFENINYFTSKQSRYLT